MIEIKFDSNNETLFIDHLKEMLTKNPILLQNIIEPSVNTIISDSDIPKIVKDKVTENYSQYLTGQPLDQTIKTILTSLLNDAMGEYNVETMIERAIETKVEAEDIESSINSEIERVIEEAGNVESLLSDAISNKVDDEIRGNEIQDALKETVEEAVSNEHLDIDQAVKDYAIEKVDEDLRSIVTEYLDEQTSATVEPMLKLAVNSRIDSDFSKEAIEAMVKAEIQTKLSFVKDLVVSSQPMGSPPVVIPENYAAIKIRCKPELKDKVIEIINRISLLQTDNSIIIE